VLLGTNKDFNQFSKNVFANFKTPQDKLGFFFASDPEYASQYADGNGGRVMPVYLSISNPKIEPLSKIDEIENGTRQQAGRYIAQLKRDGYDGIIFGNNVEIVAFEPTQIKSATGNIGTYDITNPDIRKSLRSPDTKEFNDWFSDSKAVNKEGRPVVMYHGTARDISEFKPGVANAIFVSPDPEFAEIFSEDSFNWLANNAKDELSEADQTKTKETAIEQIEKDYDWLDKKDPPV